MGIVSFNVVDEEEYVFIHFELNGILAPEDLRSVIPPRVNGGKGVVISGRGPIWLYSYLTHFYHPTRFVAVYDPRVCGGVIVETHTRDYEVGDVIEEKPVFQ